ncbi:hypothetical protein BC567DRAFT_238649 [Phyllosticta citribraziliensis]
MKADSTDSKCEVLWLSCNLEDLQYWKFVVNDPTLARTVILIVLDDSTFSEALLDPGVLRELAGPHLNQNCILQTSTSNPSFQRDWRRQLALKSHRPQVREQMLVRQCEWMRNQVEAHLDIRDNMLDKELFRQTLKRNLLPNFTKVDLTNLPTERLVYSRPEQSYTPPSRSPSVLQWEDEYPEGPLPVTGVRPRNFWPWSSRDASDRLEDMEQGFAPATNTCLHLPPRCVPEFSIIPGSDYPEKLLRGTHSAYQTGFPMTFFLPPFSNRFQQQVSDLEWVVENLTTFRLVAGCSGLQAGETFSGFFQLLSRARKLKSLQLHIEEWRDDPRDVLDSISSPSLKEVDFDGIEFSRHAFLKFLSKHPNLKSLSLYGCLYKGQCWWELLTAARVTHSLLRTEKLYINQAVWRHPDGDYAEEDRLELPEMSREYGMARWGRWMADPRKETFPFQDGTSGSLPRSAGAGRL